MAKHPLDYDLIIFDADGTLRRCTAEGQPCPNNSEEWEILENVYNVIGEYPAHKTQIGIASNQGGVSLGFLSLGMAFGLLYDLYNEMTAGHDRILCPPGMIQMCPHTGIKCSCRKPEPGMLMHIMNHAGVSVTRTLFVGDMESDKEAARNARCDFMWAHEFFGWEKTP